MLAILTTILTVLSKVLGVVAKVALSRVTFVLIFIVTIGGTIATIFAGLTDQSSFLNDVISGVQSAMFTLGTFIEGNEFIQLVSNCLALDTAFTVVIDILLTMFLGMIGLLVVAWFGVIFAVLPLLAEIVVSAIQRNFTDVLNSN